MLVGANLDRRRGPNDVRDGVASIAMSHRDYLETRRFPAIDGLRAVSILLVLTWHVNSTVWHRLQGWEGVTVFFVISGFVITTPLLREHDRSGRVALGSFYRRRAYRILPVYLVVLLLYLALVVGLDWHHHRGLFDQALPYYLSFLNDFAPFTRDTPFAQSWSLGVEEKFYVVWPLLAFVLLPAFRGRVATALALAPFLLLPFGVFGWFYAYADIMVGCLLAVALHHPRGFELATRWLRFWPSAVVLVALWALIPVGRPVEYLFPFAVAAVMVSLTTGSPAAARLLETGPARWMGRLSYSVYLTHLLVASVVVAAGRKAGLWLGPTGLPHGIVANAVVLFAVTAGSFALASVLYRWVEQPWIDRGRRTRVVVVPVPA